MHVETIIASSPFHVSGISILKIFTINLWSLNHLLFKTIIATSPFVMKLKGRTHRLLPLTSHPGVRHSKRRWVTCCICRWNSWCLCEFSNCPWLHKKQVVSWVNERNEIWQWCCVNWIPFIATRSDEQNGQPQSSKMAQICLAGRVLEV